LGQTKTEAHREQFLSLNFHLSWVDWCREQVEYYSHKRHLSFQVSSAYWCWRKPREAFLLLFKVQEELFSQ